MADSRLQLDEAKECIRRCIQLRERGSVESVLRHELTSRLRSMYPGPEDANWVNRYAEGAEAGTRIAESSGATSQRFVDVLVSRTIIEFESDLRKSPRFKKGREQVREYLSGAVRSGTPISQLRGILSDTVTWHVYDGELREDVSPSDCMPSDITLMESSVLDLKEADAESASKLLAFLRKHLARQQSRSLSAKHIASDLGLESRTYGEHSHRLRKVVEDARSIEPSVHLATDLWSRFVDSLEGARTDFRSSAYVDEAYIAVLARLLCANVLQRRAILSDGGELSAILDGAYFVSHFFLHNVVEQDYFGWLWADPHIRAILPVARDMQRDLYAYDFSQIEDEDLFGRLMTQLARRSERRLLGQEWTPQWLARAIAKGCVERLPPTAIPRIIDMCCGSGAIIAEALKEIKASRGDISREELFASVTGFDIDPLAVLLAKTTWVITVADQVRQAAGEVTIPIYHADSLFATTPTTRSLPFAETASEITVDLDGETVQLPAGLVAPEMQRIFDGMVDWAYDEARDAVAHGNAGRITQARTDELISSLIGRHPLDVEPALQTQLKSSAFELAQRMALLALDNRNGIWAFILRNTYRPGLLAGQFNGLVCNPPWLALSQFADNPYKEQLSARANAYGIKPGGAAHLHLELGTTHLLHAIDRYLETDATVACLVPGTILNGQHHAKFREFGFLQSDRAVPFEISEIWNIPPGTFKVRAAAVVGVKRASTGDVRLNGIQGRELTATALRKIEFEVRRLGRRTAWVLGGANSTVREGTEEASTEGADLMPRRAVCVEVISRTGVEWRVRTPRSDDSGYFAVKGSKKLQGKHFDGLVAPQFIHLMAQSLNLLPFALSDELAEIAIPAVRGDDGEWEYFDASKLRARGFAATSRRFQKIDEAMLVDKVAKPLVKKIDERRKLSLQTFPDRGYLVINGAGGGVACAAVVDLSRASKLVIDQTLYWTLVSSEDDAWYRVGMMNSDALTEATREFNPEGELGPRHLHTLPNRVTPQFVPGNSDQLQIASIAMALSKLAVSIIGNDAKIADQRGPIASRRKRLRKTLQTLPEYAHLENVCASLLNVTT